MACGVRHQFLTIFLPSPLFSLGRNRYLFVLKQLIAKSWKLFLFFLSHLIPFQEFLNFRSRFVTEMILMGEG